MAEMKLEAGARVMVINHTLDGREIDEGVATLKDRATPGQRVRMSCEYWNVEFDSEPGETFARWVSREDILDDGMPLMTYRIEPGLHGERRMMKLIIRGQGTTGVSKQIEIGNYTDAIRDAWIAELEEFGYRVFNPASKDVKA